jgi:hypothetical protein
MSKAMTTAMTTAITTAITTVTQTALTKLRRAGIVVFGKWEVMAWKAITTSKDGIPQGTA